MKTKLDLAKKHLEENPTTDLYKDSHFKYFVLTDEEFKELRDYARLTLGYRITNLIKNPIRHKNPMEMNYNSLPASLEKTAKRILMQAWLF